MIAKLRNKLNFTSALVATTLLFSQVQSVHAADIVISTDTTVNAGTTISLTGTDTLTINSGVTYTFNQTSYLEGINVNTGATGVVITNNGTIVQNYASSINLHGDGIVHFINNGTLINNNEVYNYAMLSLAGGDSVFTLTNNGVIFGLPSESAQSFLFFLNSATGPNNVINLNKGSIVSGLFASNKDFNLNMNVGASKTYNYKTDHTYFSGNAIVSELNNRPSISSINYASAINIGSIEMAGENLYQNTSNIIDAVDSNINTAETWVRPYYSESNRDSEGDSSAIRKFKNTKQGFTAGGAVKNSEIPLQFILNVDQSENNIDSGEHKIDSNSITLGLVAPNFNKVGDYNLSLKGLIGYSKNDTDRKILDNTSSTGERVITGDYNSFNAIVGASLAKTINLDNGVKANIAIGADVVSEIRDSFSESLYFSYDKLNLVQLQPKIQSEFVKTLNNTSNAFVKVGVEARELLSGKTQDFSANSIKTSYTTPTTNDVYGTVVVGFNSKINNTINLFAEASAKNSGEEVSTYQASIGIKGTF